MFIAALLIAACAGQQRPTVAASRAQLIEQATAWDRAIIAKDIAGVRRNMDPDFQQIAGDGSRHDHDEFLDLILSPKLTIDPYTVEDLEVEIEGDVAFLRGRTRMTGRYDGEPFVSDYRYLDVYLFRSGQWRVRHVQITPVRR